ACQTPRLTDSATRCRWTLHGASSDQVVAMPITGRPSKTSGVKPWLRIQPRYAMPDRPVAPNHCVLRSPPPEGVLSAVIQPLVTSGLRRGTRQARSGYILLGSRA